MFTFVDLFIGWMSRHLCSDDVDVAVYTAAAADDDDDDDNDVSSARRVFGETSSVSNFVRPWEKLIEAKKIQNCATQKKLHPQKKNFSFDTSFCRPPRFCLFRDSIVESNSSLFLVLHRRRRRKEWILSKFGIAILIFFRSFLML